MSGLNDGWEQDEDLAVSEDGDGWGEDDNFFDDDENENGVHAVEEARVYQENKHHIEVVNDGWEDDDMAGFGDEWNDDNDGNAQGESTRQATIEHHSLRQEDREEAVDGEREIPRRETDGWSDDEDAFGQDLEDDGIPPYHPDAKVEALARELESYVRSLPHMLSSINAILEFEYNTPEKSQELQDYYTSRVNLAGYTREKELERMEYLVYLPYGHIETNKAQIAELLPDESLISRCSNQSLLADLLQVMTGSDLLVRPQYLASCYAHWCQFKIHFGEDRGGMVHCQAKLQLSLPTSSGPRLTVAEVSAMVVFIPNQPMVEYHLTTIDLLLDDEDFAKLTGTAEFISAIEGHLDEFPGQDQRRDGNFRDNFVENSQIFFTQSTKGMKSALQQMESVANIQQKLNLLSKLLPDTEHVLAAEEEAMAYAAHEQHRRNNQFPRPPPDQSFAGQTANPTPVEHSTNNRFPRPPETGPKMHPPPSQPSGESQRPKSILGGLMRSGLSRLAKTVTIPEDQDPAIYGASSPPSASQPTRLYLPEPSVPLPTSGLQRNAYSKNELNFEKPPEGPPTLPQIRQPGHRDILKEPEGCSISDHVEGNESTPKLLYAGGINGKPRIVEPNSQEQPQSTPAPPPDVGQVPIAEMARDENIEDGWGSSDEEGDQINDSESETNPETNNDIVEMPPSTSPEQLSFSSANNPKPRRVLLADVEYNPDDDIIATRTRWVNPRPHRPYSYAWNGAVE